MPGCQIISTFSKRKNGAVKKYCKHQEWQFYKLSEEMAFFLLRTKTSFLLQFWSHKALSCGALHFELSRPSSFQCPTQVPALFLHFNSSKYPFVHFFPTTFSKIHSFGRGPEVVLSIFFKVRIVDYSEKCNFLNFCSEIH